MLKANTPAPSADAYECVSPIDHDGHRIEVGDLVEMPADVAEPLLAAGALKAREPQAPTADPQA